MESLIMIIYEISTSFIPFIITLIILNYNYKSKLKTKISKERTLLLTIFAIYITGVFYFTGSGTIWDGIFRNFDIRYEYINIFPFSNYIDIIGYILNIILFIPFGFLITLIWKKIKSYIVVILGFVFSLLIEVSQLLNNRSTDIDDLILNTSGAIIGFIICRLCNKIFKVNYKENYFKYEIVIIISVMFLGKFLLFNEHFIASILYGF